MRTRCTSSINAGNGMTYPCVPRSGGEKCVVLAVGGSRLRHHRIKAASARRALTMA